MSPRSCRAGALSAAFLLTTLAGVGPAAAATPGRVLSLATPDPTTFVHALESARLGVAGRRALEYLARIEERDWSDYLARVRPPALTPREKSLWLTMVRRQDIVSPSRKRQAKLDSLQPILEYLVRRDVVDVIVLRGGLVWSGFLEGAAVIVTEEAVDTLSAGELQAVVAHELGHEYFAQEYKKARDEKDWDAVQEVELRSDAIAIVTMKTLGLRPEALLEAVAKLERFNERKDTPSSKTLTPSLDERERFHRIVIDLHKSARLRELPLRDSAAQEARGGGRR